ncbi:MAG TPA: IS1595 family transposase [Candidatus Angelobacter sp.]|nr:IS1595 family transposase [Candidatus Angelobacter sp.]
MEQPKTLQQATQHFSDEQVCIQTVAAVRWPDGPSCPACGHKEHYYLKTQKRWKCKECNKQFTVKLGTIFEDSPIPLNKWLVALWMLSNCRNGISSYEVARAIGITQKSAWFVLHRLRLAMQRKSLLKIGGSGSPVEVDETFIGGKARNMHRSRRAKMNVRSHSEAKTVVLGMLERGGHVRTQVIRDRKKPNLLPPIHENVAQGSNLITDEYPVYFDLRKEYEHEVVNHLETYVQGHVHTNGIENFWSLLKRGLNGTYVAVEPFHLFRYVDEQAFRFNNRKGSDNKPLSDSERFTLALSQIAGKRLTFAEVTGKVGETAF